MKIRDFLFQFRFQDLLYFGFKENKRKINKRRCFYSQGEKQCKVLNLKFFKSKIVKEKIEKKTKAKLGKIRRKLSTLRP